MIPQRFVTVVDSLYQYYVGPCPFDPLNVLEIGPISTLGCKKEKDSTHNQLGHLEEAYAVYHSKRPG
jgi:hypothetical protein